jgi:hypothetical protein
VVRSAPRISPRLLEALVRLDDERVPIAEVGRRVGGEADRLGLTRPSYQRIRVLVHELRRVRRTRPTSAFVLFVVALRVPPRPAVGRHASQAARKAARAATGHRRLRQVTQCYLRKLGVARLRGRSWPSPSRRPRRHVATSDARSTGSPRRE